MKYKNWKGERLLSSILYLLTPFAFMANPLLFVVCVTAQLVLQTLHGYRFSELFVVLLLNGFVYSSVSFAGLRFYDWIIIFSFVYVFINRRGYVAIPVRLLIFSTSIFLVFLFHGMETNEILEVVRYFVSILLIVVVLNTKPDMNLISESIIRICKVTLYNAIIVFAMIQLGRVHNYMSSFISTNVYIYSDEVRLNGFFSDPNKYMTFCLALLFIIDVFIENPTYKRNGILILSIATVLSMSRTALLCLGFYFFVKLLLKLKDKSPVLFGCCIITFSVVCILLLAAPDIINSIINELYTLAARVLGREHTLEINATMKDDNRRFYARMLETINLIVGIACMVLILFTKVIAGFLYAKDFYSAWEYVPFLLLSTVFSASAGMVGPILSAKKNTKALGTSTLFGALTNIVFNIALVSIIGAQGAAIATALSSFLIFLLRYISAKKEIEGISLPRLFGFWIVICIQACLMIDGGHYLGQVVLIVVGILMYKDNIGLALKCLKK